jgi:drug/metabolite transporter (DMT)-like permease
MSPIVWVVGWGVFLSLVFAAIQYFNLQQTLSVSLIFAALVLVPLLALYFSGFIVGEFVQPRYLTALLGMLVAASMFRSSMSTGLVMSRAQVWIIGFALIFAHIIALRTNLGRYLTGMSQVATNLDYGFEWWWVDRPASNELFWFSPNLVWITGSIAFAVFLVSLWKLKAELGLPGYLPESVKDIELAESSVTVTKSATKKRKTNSPKKALAPKKVKPRK